MATLPKRIKLSNGIRLPKFLASVLLLALTASSNAQLVYVKCCFKQVDVYCLGPVLTGPIRHWTPNHTWYEHIRRGTCIYGFGPSIKSIDLQAEMCVDYILPDQSDAHCTWWREGSIDIIDLCWGWSGYGNTNYVIYDYDGDGDLDLRDFARFQNEFGREIGP